MGDHGGRQHPIVKTDHTGIYLNIRVQPRSKKNMFAGLMDHALKIKLTAPPVDGAANTQCRQFLSDLLDLPKSSIEIVRGKTGRNKTVLLRVSSQGQRAQIIQHIQQLSNTGKTKTSRKA